jgi:glutathione S-transferase
VLAKSGAIIEYLLERHGNGRLVPARGNVLLSVLDAFCRSSRATIGATFAFRLRRWSALWPLLVPELRNVSGGDHAHPQI